MLRRSLLWLSRQPAIFRFIKSNRLARAFASRFVAGETIDSAIAAAVTLRGRDITASLDVLGESVAQAADAEAACARYLTLLDRLAEANVEVNVSVKLTQMGLDLDPALCERNMRLILERARARGGFVRLDMESSEYTRRTLDFFEQRVQPEFGAHAGVVIQSALRRSTTDIEHLIGLGARVRLCKGAYLEPETVAFPDKKDVDAHYGRLLEQLLLRGNYPGIATHDEKIIARAEIFARNHGIGPDRFEFQMLFGVRRDLQVGLRARGWRVRVYVPFGTQWYPYLMRRLAERPANIAFILGNVIREGTSRTSTPS
ncbi:MAG TPA: proline dehydrogenase family protein [Gemmatimonadales bacterium]|nr:proline dehydrogenase family protein [Gemmatimonadales bacterium]